MKWSLQLIWMSNIWLHWKISAWARRIQVILTGVKELFRTFWRFEESVMVPVMVWFPGQQCGQQNCDRDTKIASRILAVLSLLELDQLLSDDALSSIPPTDTVTWRNIVSFHYVLYQLYISVITVKDNCLDMTLHINRSGVEHVSWMANTKQDIRMINGTTQGIL